MARGEPGDRLGLLNGRPKLLWGLKQRQTGWREALDTSPGALVRTRAPWGLEELPGGSRVPAPELTGLPPASLLVLRLEIPKVFVSPPSAKAASVRALLFDISFLMLCHVAQTYGSEVSILRGDGALTLGAQPVCCSLPASSSGQPATATVPTVPAAALSRGVKHPVLFTWCR